MPTLAFPSLNGTAPSWADINITTSLLGVPLLPMSEIAAIKWSRKVEVGQLYGASGGRVMKRTTGVGSQEASMSLYRSGLRTLIRSLMLTAPIRGTQRLISQVTFDISIQHTPPGEIDIYQTKIKGCRYLGDSDDMKEGSEADKIEVTLNPIEVVQLIDGQEVVLI